MRLKNPYVICSENAGFFAGISFGSPYWTSYAVEAHTFFLENQARSIVERFADTLEMETAVIWENHGMPEGREIKI